MLKKVNKTNTPITKQQENQLRSSQVHNQDIKRRRYTNAGNSKNLQDYVTRSELLTAFPNWTGHAY